MLGGLAGLLRAQSHDIEKAAPGLLETGSPLFTVLTKESLGLNSPPTDLHLMPDGRVLVVAGQQLALGDGIRWEVFSQAADGNPSRALTVAVGDDGTIYQAIFGGFAKVVFGSDGKWRLVKVADWPATETTDRPVPRKVIVLGAQWFWHSQSGSIIAWRPGTPAQSVGRTDAVEQIFSFRDEYYVSDRVISDGTITRLDPSDKVESRGRKKVLPRGLITCALPYGQDRLLVGTSAHGVQVFDGRQSRPLVTTGVLAGGQRINDLCQSGGYIVAAVENHGIVFFDTEGRTVQSLSRTVDHRLGRVTRLISAQGGFVWGLLSDGIFQVEFPSRVSHFEPIINTGLASVHPHRLDGRLWIAADNQVSKATYDTEGRLSGFEPDTPAGQVVVTMSCIADGIVASTEQGAYFRTETGWRPFAPDTSFLRILRPTPIDGQWLFSARGEIGWLRQTADGLKLDRQPVPGLGYVYNAITDARGHIWLELGTGLLGRIDPGRPGQGALAVEIFGEAEGVPLGWAQVFVVDGVARFNVADRILRFDESTRRFVPDEAFAREFAGLGTLVGRPGRDTLGRLWVTTERGIFLFEGQPGNLRRVPEPMPAGFQPYYFTFESEGVVWMHSTRRFARYDPAFPTPSPEPLRALITSVALPGSGRTLYPAHGVLPPLRYSDNTLAARFVALGLPLTTPVTFEVKLEGTGQDWVSAGSAGSAVFNQLKEGNYVLQVRPSALGVPGVLSTLVFTINPPWYRTVPAYVAGTLLILGVVLGAAWLFTYLERREKIRLENLVARRTHELNETNTRLATQVEEIRTLSQAIQQSPVGVIITDTDGTIFFANPPVCRLSGYSLDELAGQPVRKLRAPAADDPAGTALVAALQRGDSWDGQLVNRAKDGRLIQVHVTASPLRSTAGSIHHHLYLEEDITAWLVEQERRRRLEGQLFLAQKRESLGTLAGGIAHDFNNILTGILGYNELVLLALGEDSPVKQELAGIRAAGQRAKDLVNQILTFSRQANAQLTPLDLARPVAEALKLIRASTPSTIEIVSALQPGTVRADSTQIHQVVLNLCTNAAHAMRDRPGRLEVRLEPVILDLVQAGEFTGLTAGEYLQLTIADNGCGMSPAVLDRMFDPFFTTKDPGEGTGLGLSIVQSIVAGHHGGLRVRSQPGLGTTFDIFFPRCAEIKHDPAPTLPVPQGREQEIIVVDDEPMITQFVAARLGRLGYRATALQDPRAALAALLAEPRRYTALITDLTMPHMTGVELIRRLQAGGLQLPTLIITGYNRNADRADLADLSHIPVLQKPFTGEELAQTLHRMIESARRTDGPV